MLDPIPNGPENPALEHYPPYCEWPENVTAMRFQAGANTHGEEVHTYTLWRDLAPRCDDRNCNVCWISYPRPRSMTKEVDVAD